MMAGRRQTERRSANDTGQAAVWQADGRRWVVPGTDEQTDGQTRAQLPKKRADARRNEQVLLEVAAEVFVTSGVEAPVRDIAKAAGVGMGTIYRHFPTRADLVVAAYRHQVEACAEAGPVELAKGGSPHAALGRWVNLF